MFVQAMLCATGFQLMTVFACLGRQFGCGLTCVLGATVWLWVDCCCWSATLLNHGLAYWVRLMLALTMPPKVCCHVLITWGVSHIFWHFLAGAQRNVPTGLWRLGSAALFKRWFPILKALCRVAAYVHPEYALISLLVVTCVYEATPLCRICTRLSAGLPVQFEKMPLATCLWRAQ